MRPFLTTDDEWAEAAEFMEQIERETEYVTPVYRFGARNKKSKIPQTAEEWALPLHAKKVNTLDLAIIKSMANEATWKRIAELLAFVNDIETLDRMCAESAEWAEPPTRNFKAADADAMCEGGSAERMPQGEEAKCFIVPFSVVEEIKKRRRGIMWPRRMLRWLEGKYKCEMKLKSDAEKIRRVKPNSWSVAYDLKISFHQCSVDEAARNYYCFYDDAGRLWRLSRLAMGLSVSPELMDLIVKVVAGAEGYAAIPFMAGKVDIDTHIDNVSALSQDKYDLDCYADFFTTNCNIAGVTLNDEAENVPHQKGPYCGRMYDYAAGTVEINESTRTKVNRVAEAMSNEKQGTSMISFAELQSFFGILMWATPATTMELSQAYWCLKHFRRECSNTARGSDPNRLLTIPNYAKPSYAKWIAGILHSPPKQCGHLYPQAVCNATMISDSSVKGFGILLIRDGQVYVHAGTWGEHHTCGEINRLEADAVLIGLRHFGERGLLDGARLHFIVDNTSVKFTLLQKRAKSMTLNLTIQKIVAEANARLVSYAASYIDTASMPADRPSRGEEVDEILLRNACFRFANTKPSVHCHHG